MDRLIKDFSHSNFIPLFLPSSTRSSMSVPRSVPVPVRTTSNPVIKHATKIVMLKHNHVPGKKVSTLQIRSFPKNNKVFEDRSQGVICYRDENGEIVCEGYDEGPRFPQQVPETSYRSIDEEILNLLQDTWLQIVNGGGFRYGNKGIIIVQDDS